MNAERTDFMSKTGRRRFPLFWILLGVYGVVLFCGIILGLNILSDRLAEYEYTQPGRAAKSVYEEFFTKGFDRAARQYSPALSDFESYEEFAEALETAAEGKELVWSETRVDENGVRHFAVTGGGEPFAEFVLSPTDEGVWRLDGITFAIEPVNSVTLTVYGGCRATINGVELTSAQETGRDTESHWSNAAMPLTAEGTPIAEGISTVTYTVGGLYGTPDVTAADRSGRDCVINETGDGVYVSELPYDDHRLEEVSDRVISAAEEYCRFMYRDAALTDIAVYIDSESALYARLRDAEELWSEKKEAREFSDKKVSELYFYGEDVFSCRVSMTASGEIGADSLDLTLFFYRADRAWMLCSVTENNLE